MSKKRDDPRGKQKGAQAHAEGEHGEKTREALIDELQSGEAPEPVRAEQHPAQGGNRLFERRVQHDPADRAADKNRLDRDIGRHKHVRENFQVRGGAKSHPALPPENINPSEPDAPRE